jgi:hypothetical protein
MMGVNDGLVRGKPAHPSILSPVVARCRYALRRGEISTSTQRQQRY